MSQQPNFSIKQEGDFHGVTATFFHRNRLDSLLQQHREHIPPCCTCCQHVHANKCNKWNHEITSRIRILTWPSLTNESSSHGNRIRKAKLGRCNPLRAQPGERYKKKSLFQNDPTVRSFKWTLQKVYTWFQYVVQKPYRRVILVV